MELRDYLRVARRRRWLIISATVIVAGVALAVSLVQTPMFEAEAAAARREELNLLYVAITRARQVFIASGIENGKARDGTPYRLLEAALEKLDASEVARKEAQQDVEFYKALCAAKLALGGQARPEEAVPALERILADAAGTPSNERGRAALHLAALRGRLGDRPCRRRPRTPRAPSGPGRSRGATRPWSR